MKKLQVICAGVIFILGLVFILHAQETARPVQAPPDSIVQLTAEAQGLERVPADQVSRSGTFWLVLPGPGGGITAPLPGPSSDPSLPVYQIAAGQFLVDATGGQVSVNPRSAGRTGAAALAAQADAVVSLINQVQAAQLNRKLSLAFGLAGPTPGAGGDPNSYFSSFFIDTNRLWLELTNISGGLADLNLHNGTNSVYAIWNTTNLLTGWQVAMELWPTNLTVQPFTLPTLNRENLFVRAEDWTGVDSNGDGIPDWWCWKYFADVSAAATNDYDGDGVNNLDEYVKGTDPNKINFTLRLGNQHFNTTNASGSFLVLGGVPSYEAVLVNEEDFSNAVWSAYDGTIHLNLGSTDGVYQVWLGLKGRAEDSQPTWIGTAVTLTRTAPQLFITNPITNVIGQPYLQLQGHSALPLASVTFDVSNAVAVVTNQSGAITGHTLDTNLLAYTADYFQGYDIQLTNGLNLITVHATDPAGNVTTTNLAVTLDYSAATNPVIQLTWPQNGMKICGDNFTLRGWTDDASAKISAQIVDASGNTNTLAGLVERTGIVWVENLPLVSGTNWLTLSVTNAAGLLSATNITVVKSSMTVTLDSMAGDLWLPAVSVAGSISDAASVVWVNGVAGTNNGDGTWRADNVPVSTSGVASFDVTAYPASEAPAGSSSGTGVNPADANAPNTSTNAVKDSEVVLESAAWESHSVANVDLGFGGGLEFIHDKGNYTHADGGNFTHHIESHDTNGTTVYSATTVDTLAPNLMITLEHSEDNQGVDTNRYNVGSFTIAQELGSLSFVGNLGQIKSLDKFSQVKLMLHIGGQAMAGSEALVEAGVGDGTEELIKTPYSLGIDVTNLTVEGLGKNLGPDGLAYGKAAVGSSVSINLTAPVPYHSFNDGAGAHTLESVLYDCGLPPSRTTIGIGEVAHCYMSGRLSVNWSVTGGGSISATNGSGTDFINHRPSTSTIHAEKDGNELTKIFTVIAPSSITVISNWDEPLGTANPNGTMMRAETFYQVVIGPTNVSFGNVTFRENVSPIIIHWPCGIVETNMPQIGFPGVPCDHLLKDDIVTQADASKIFDGTNYVNFSFSSIWTDQYQDDSGNWVDFQTLNVTREYHSNRQAHVIYMGVPGGWQGPY